MPFVEPQDIPGKPWGTETLLAHTEHYTLKRLVYEAGHQGAFQLHVEKDEAFTWPRARLRLRG
jgi:mannose-6-phosphate isomerase-like protein (cupin superfamily)